MLQVAPRQIPKQGRRSYSPEQLKRAYDMWKSGLYTMYKASKLCGVPETTLRDRARGRVDPLNDGYGPAPLLHHNEESELVSHVKYVSSLGYGYTRREMAQLVGETAFFLGRRDTS